MQYVVIIDKRFVQSQQYSRTHIIYLRFPMSRAPDAGPALGATVTCPLLRLVLLLSPHAPHPAPQPPLVATYDSRILVEPRTSVATSTSVATVTSTASTVNAPTTVVPLPTMTVALADVQCCTGEQRRCHVVGLLVPCNVTTDAGVQASLSVSLQEPAAGPGWTLLPEVGIRVQQAAPMHDWCGMLLVASMPAPMLVWCNCQALHPTPHNVTGTMGVRGWCTAGKCRWRSHPDA